jgi:hypothetical protein
MVNIAEITGALSRYSDAQRELERCRQRAIGDVEYFSFSFTQDLKQAENDLEQTLNAYIDQRVAKRLETSKPALAFEQPAPGVRAAPLIA